MTKKISMIFALLLLIGGGLAGVFLVKNGVSFSPKASPETTPKQVKITNLTSNDFVVSWITENPAAGFVKVGTSQDNLTLSIADNRDKLTGDTGQYRTHYVAVTDLDPETDYFFKIGSESLLYDRNGQPFSIKTPGLLGTPTDFKVYGKVITTALTAAEGAIVYVTLAGATPLSGLVESNGNYLIPISTARSLDLRTYANFDSTTTTMSVVVESGRGDSTKVAATTGQSQPIPDITIGQSLLDPNANVNALVANPSPSPTVYMPPATPTAEPAPATMQLVIEELPVDNAIIYETQPELNGSAPPYTNLEITINSSPVYTGSVIADASGNWSFQVPGNLEPGPHTITIAYTDQNGILQRFTRSFVVQASAGTGGAYGSGNTIPPSPTPTPAPTLAPRAAYPDQTQTMPQSGSTAQTWLAILAGATFLLLGVTISGRNLLKGR